MVPVIQGRKDAVRAENQRRLQEIEGREMTYDAKDEILAHEFRAALNDLVVDRTLKIKKGARVILVTNLDINSKLVNGSQGIVVGFEQCLEEWPIVCFGTDNVRTCRPSPFDIMVEGTVVARRIIVPLILGWELICMCCET